MEGIAREITTNPVACGILTELHRALRTLTADLEAVLGMGCQGDVMRDEEVLTRLRAWNAAAEARGKGGPEA